MRIQSLSCVNALLLEFSFSSNSCCLLYNLSFISVSCVGDKHSFLGSFKFCKSQTNRHAFLNKIRSNDCFICSCKDFIFSSVAIICLFKDSRSCSNSLGSLGVSAISSKACLISDCALDNASNN